MYILEIGELLGDSLMDKIRGAHWIDMLEVFFQNGPYFLWGLSLNDRLMLISNKFGYYACRFTHYLIVILFTVQHFLNEDVWCKLCSCEFYIDKVLLDSFDFRPLFLYDCLPTSLLSKVTHGIGFLSWVVCWATEDGKGFILGLFLVGDLGF